MPKPIPLSPTQHATITASLFRREDTSTIARTHSISERQVRRIAQNLRNYGTVSAPRTKKMGRPNVLTKEIEDDLKRYVAANPLALLSDMQSHINNVFEVKVSRASLSRRMRELGFTRGLLGRNGTGNSAGAGGGPGDNREEGIPELSHADYARLVNEEGSSAASGMGVSVSNTTNEAILPGGANTRTKYAWLLNGEPVQRRGDMDGGVHGGLQREKKQRGMVGSGKGHRERQALQQQQHQQSQMDNTRTAMDGDSSSANIQPDLETASANAMGINHHEDLDVLGNVASLSAYASMPIDQQQQQQRNSHLAHGDASIDSSAHHQQGYFQPLRQQQHLPPYLPPLERALQGVGGNPFQSARVEYPS